MTAGPCLKKDGLAVKRKADAKLALVLAGEDRAVLDHRLGVAGRQALYGDHSTLSFSLVK